MTRDEFIQLLLGRAARAGLDVTTHWPEVPLMILEARRPGLSAPVLNVRLRIHGPDHARRMHVSFLRPGETVRDDVPVPATGLPATNRHHDVGLGNGEEVRDAVDAFKEEARRASRLVASEVNEASLRRAVLDAVADDPQAAADLVAAVMVEAGLGTSLQVSLDECLSASPTP